MKFKDGVDRNDGVDLKGAVDRSGRRDAWVISRTAVLVLVLAVPLVFDPYRTEVFAPVKILMLDATVGVGLVGAALAVVITGGHRLRPLPAIDLAAAAFLLLNLLAYVHSMDRAASLHGQFPEYQGLTTTLAYAAAYLLARLSFTWPQHLAALFVVLTAVTAVIGGYALLQRTGLDPVWGTAKRPFGTVGQANSMAAMLVVALPAAVWTALNRRSWLRAAALVAVLLGSLALLTSISRGAWLAALVAGGLGVALIKPGRRRPVLLGLAALGVVAVLAMLVTTPGRGFAVQAGHRVHQLDSTAHGSTGAHLTLWKVGVGLAGQHPLLGTGPQVFPELAQGYADAHLPDADAALLRPYRAESPHNVLLSIAVDAGLPALLAYLILIAAIVAMLLGARRRGRPFAVPVLVILVAYLVAGQFITPEVSSTVTVWVLLGAACAVLPVCPGEAGDPAAGAPDSPAPLGHTPD